MNYSSDTGEKGAVWLDSTSVIYRFWEGPWLKSWEKYCAIFSM